MVEVLTLSHIKLRMTEPVADGALVHNGQSSDVIVGVVFTDPAACFTDDDHDFTFVIACNSIHIGKGMKMAPSAELDDGLIDLLIVDGNITRQRLFSVLPKLFDGTHVNEPEVSYHQASTFSLFPETNDILNIDGEMVGTTPITVRVLKHAVEIFA